MYKGHDGREYPTSETLQRANEKFWESQKIPTKDIKQLVKPIPVKEGDLFFIVHDAVEGRREIPAGASDVRVCIGHKIGYRDGKPFYVPVYVARNF